MPTRFVSLLLLLFAASAPAAISQTSVSVTYNYAPLSYPGAPVTNVNGINNSNVVVGYYYDSQYFGHGFIYRAGKYTPVNFPGATMTEVLGINDLGDMVGVYQVLGPLNFHGFVLHKGIFKTIDSPAAQFGTTAFGINREGTIVGSYDNAHGFVYRHGSYKTVDAPQLPGEPPNTQLNGVNNLGWISGQVFSGGIWRGFWIIGDDFDFLEAPGFGDSQVTGMNARGDIVGCHDANAGFISFAVEDAETNAAGESPPVQEKLASCATAVNDARVVVGYYFTLQRPYGFVAVPRKGDGDD